MVPRTVLVVEDHPLNMKLVRDLLLAQGYRVLTAVDGAAMRAALRDEVPDLILMDLRLPDTDGITLLHEIRAEPRLAAVKVAVVTASAMQDEVERIRAAGFIGYLTKPLSMAPFLAQVREWLA